MNRILLSLFVLSTAFACAKSDPGSSDLEATNPAADRLDSVVSAPPDGQVENVFTNGKIYTVNPEQEWAEVEVPPGIINGPTTTTPVTFC